MPDINAILSGLILPAESSGQSTVARESSSGGASQDVFVQGQWWANQAKAKDPSSANGEQKGNRLQRDAAKAYGQQQNAGAGEAAAGQGNGTAAQGDPAGRGGSGDANDAASGTGKDTKKTKDAAVTERNPNGTALSQQELQEVAQLKAIDTKVRAHEMAHLAVAGSLAMGGMNFQYEKGPDGKSYAVAGDVSINASKGATPQATIDKMRVVRAAALAPADPSAQDRKVAAEATATMGQAEQQLFLQRVEQMKAQAENVQASNSADSTPQASSSTDGTASQKGQSAGIEEKARQGLIARYLGGGVSAADHGFAAVA